MLKWRSERLLERAFLGCGLLGELPAGTDEALSSELAVGCDDPDIALMGFIPAASAGESERDGSCMNDRCMPSSAASAAASHNGASGSVAYPTTLDLLSPRSDKGGC